ncbi:MAG: hypothetical protein LBE78_05745 [Burkholderiaceae bacterium]|jgi:hypothetical protein|nr:hypothetical protein [Burkholderiaceae bacterium]
MSEGWVCARGACVLVPSGPDQKKHLFTIMLDPVPWGGYGPNPMVLMACASSVKAGIDHDQACQIKAGEHPFIEHDSFIDYRFTRIEPVAVVEAHVKSGFLPQRRLARRSFCKKSSVGHWCPGASIGSIAGFWTHWLARNHGWALVSADTVFDILVGVSRWPGRVW